MWSMKKLGKYDKDGCFMAYVTIIMSIFLWVAIIILFRLISKMFFS